jgi:FkbM family methyltransferase
MLRYFKESFRRKKARRITAEYPPILNTFNLSKDGQIEFANWSNPLVEQIEISQSYVDFFRKFIKDGDLVIDIGANIGDTTVPMGIAAGKNGLTIGFDPNPYIFKILDMNATLNKDKTNIIPYLNAITVHEAEFFYLSSEASFSNGYISPVVEKSKYGKFVFPQKIKGIVLSELLEKEYKHKLDKLSFIKVDTEGYDKEILKSISKILRKYKPSIVAEIYPHNTDEEKMELFQVLKEHNYNLFQFDDFLVDTPIKEIKNKEEVLLWRTKVDLFATPE